MNQRLVRHENRFRIPPEHPAFPGHFPGAPIVPGVVLLDQVLAAAESWLCCTVQPTGLPRVKFLAPLLPGEEAKLSLELADAILKFEISRGGEAIAAGLFKLAYVVAALPAIGSGRS